MSGSGKRRLSSRRLSTEETAEAREKRKACADFYNRIKQLGRPDPSDQDYLRLRHLIIAEVIEYLGKDIEVFQCKMTDHEYITDTILLTTPTFWFKNHKWKARDVQFLMDSIGLKRSGLDKESRQTWGSRSSLDPRSKKKKRHIRRSSMMHLANSRRQAQARHKKSASSWLSDIAQIHKVGKEVYAKLVESRGGPIKSPTINEAQWNIQLNDRGIVVDPDLSFRLYYCMLSTKESAEEEQDLTEEEMLAKLEAKAKADAKAEVLTEEEAQLAALEENKRRRKKCKKTPIGADHFIAVLLKLQEKISGNSKLRSAKAKDILAMDDDLQTLVLFQKVVEAIAYGSTVNINETYLVDRLTEEELNDASFVLRELSTRKSEWRRRLEILTYVEENLDDPEKFDDLLSDDNFPSFILGWTAQMLDDRSQLSGAAVQLFPSIVSAAIVRMESAHTFFETNDTFLQEIFVCLFTVLRGRRAVDLCKMAEIAAIQTMDILANVCQGAEEVGGTSMKERSMSITLAAPLVDAPSASKKSGAITPTVKSASELTVGGETGFPSVRDPMKSQLRRASSSSAASPKSSVTMRKSSSVTPSGVAADRMRQLDAHGRKRSMSGAVVRAHLSELVSQDAYLDLLAVLLKHSSYHNEKHESVRAACVTLLGYLIYGIDIEAEDRSEDEERKKKKAEAKKKKAAKKKKKKSAASAADGSSSAIKKKPGKAEADEDEKSSGVGASGSAAAATDGSAVTSVVNEKVYMHRVPARGFLFELDTFAADMVEMVENCVNDKAELVRTTTLKLLEKVEKHLKPEGFDDFFSRDTVTRYRKHMARKARSKGGKKKGGMSAIQRARMEAMKKKAAEAAAAE